MQTNEFFRFRKRKSVNMQEINLEFRIMDHTTEGAKGFFKEGYDQGSVLSNNDLALLLNISPSTNWGELFKNYPYGEFPEYKEVR